MDIYSLQVMKPNKVKNDKLKDVIRLDSLLDSPEYAAEEKIDGCHYNLFGARFLSTEKVDKTENFPHLTKFFIELGMPNLILDGEINYPGRTSQYCTRVTGAGAGVALKFQQDNDFIHYTIFDILRTPKGNWTLNNTYAERRKILEYFYAQYIEPTPMKQYIHLSTLEMDNKRQFLEILLAEGKEGIVLKRLNSLYQMGKKPMWEWMKIKQEDETDLVITGFDPPTREYNGKDIENWPYWAEPAPGAEPIPVTKFYYNDWIGAIRLGAYVNGKLEEVCTTSGISEDLREKMSKNPNDYIGRAAKIQFMERTEAGIPRHPKFISMHEGKRPEECTWSFQGR